MEVQNLIEAYKSNRQHWETIFCNKNNFQWEMASVMEWGDWEARRTPPAGWNEEQARAKAKLV